MTFNVIFLLVMIGLVAGAMSGFIGIGGGVIMVPALVYIMHLTQHEAQGTSLILMLPPIGILAVMNYYKAGQLSNTHITYGLIIAIAFIIGGYYGSKLSLKLNPNIVKLIFGVMMLYIAAKMIIGGYKGVREDSRASAVEEVIHTDDDF
jgi:uncharacterized membrane protein YfcA